MCLCGIHIGHGTSLRFGPIEQKTRWRWQHRSKEHTKTITLLSIVYQDIILKLML